VASCRHLVEQESRTRDVRLQRALQEVERYKQLLQEVKSQVGVVRPAASSLYDRGMLATTTGCGTACISPRCCCC
jgi:hypothetical protein